MKTLLFTIIIFLLVFELHGQKYVPFPVENANWNVLLNNDWIYGNILRRYSVLGDTTINEEKFNKLYIESGDTLNPKHQYIGAYREENKRIYYRGKAVLNYKTSNDEMLLYDFTKQIGDTIWNSKDIHVYSIVNDIDSVYIDGSYRKRYQVYNDLLYYNPDYIIEGIGSVKNGLLAHISRSFLPEVGEHIWEHICFRENEIVKYLNPTFNECFPDDLYTEINKLEKNSNFCFYPNPFRGELNILNRSNHSNLILRITDIYGLMLIEKKIHNGFNSFDLLLNTGIYNALIINKHGNILECKKLHRL